METVSDCNGKEMMPADILEDSQNCAKCTSISIDQVKDKIPLTKPPRRLVKKQKIMKFFRCWKCGHESKTIEDISEHFIFCSYTDYKMKAVKYKAIYECSECTYQSPTLFLHKHHWRTVHNGEEILKTFQYYICSICCQVRKNPDDFRCHEEEDLQLGYNCPQCTWKCITTQKLYSHFVIHTHILKLSCNICLQQFERSERLLHKHKNISHFSVQLYRCTSCAYVHKYSENVEAHLSKAHKIFNCILMTRKRLSDLTI